MPDELSVTDALELLAAWDDEASPRPWKVRGAVFPQDIIGGDGRWVLLEGQDQETLPDDEATANARLAALAHALLPLAQALERIETRAHRVLTGEVEPTPFSISSYDAEVAGAALRALARRIGELRGDA